MGERYIESLEKHIKTLDEIIVTLKERNRYLQHQENIRSTPDFSYLKGENWMLKDEISDLYGATVYVFFVGIIFGILVSPVFRFLFQYLYSLF